MREGHEPSGAEGQRQPAVKYPYAVDDADHCETPAEAYAHVVPILQSVASSLGKAPSELRVWDPYYCQGRVKRQLAALGFPNVHNECEDFYARLRANDLPEHDVLVTSKSAISLLQLTRELS